MVAKDHPFLVAYKITIPVDVPCIVVKELRRGVPQGTSLRELKNNPLLKGEIENLGAPLGATFLNVLCWKRRPSASSRLKYGLKR